MQQDILNKMFCKYVGYQESSYPMQHKESLDLNLIFTQEEIEKNLSHVEMISKDAIFDTYQEGKSMDEMCQVVKSALHAKYPELDDISLEAACWCYSYWWR